MHYDDVFLQDWRRRHDEAVKASETRGSHVQTKDDMEAHMQSVEEVVAVKMQIVKELLVRTADSGRRAGLMDVGGKRDGALERWNSSSRP